MGVFALFFSQERFERERKAEAERKAAAAKLGAAVESAKAVVWGTVEGVSCVPEWDAFCAPLLLW